MYQLFNSFEICFGQSVCGLLLPEPRLTHVQELASITDQRVELSLRTPDTNAGKWLAEDPSLQQIQRITGVCNGSGNGR